MIRPRNTPRKPRSPRPGSCTATTPTRPPNPAFCQSQDWLVEGVVPAQGLGVFYGGPGTGKSALVIDMVRCISAGLPWFGREVSRQQVWYIALECGAGLRMRVVAAEKRYGQLVQLKSTNGKDV